MKITLLLLLSYLLILNVNAQVVNIPDANFKTALLNHVPVIDLNSDGQIQVSEAVAFTGNISVSNKNISDLAGIEAFINIQALYCTNNQLNSLTFSNFTRLTTIDCRLNQLTSLNVSNLPSLVILTCHVNQLTTLPLNEMPLLKYLSCYSNQITSLVFDNSHAPVQVECYNNKLTTLSIANVNSLKILDCGSNQIISLSIGNAPALTNFNCAANKLTSLSLGSAPLLTYLPCSDNLLTSLTLNDFPSLQTINCRNNLITSISLNNTNALQQLFCSDNKLINLTLSNYPFLKRIDCDHNMLVSIILNNLPALQNVYGNYNLLTSVSLNNLPVLQSLSFDFSQLLSLNLSNLPALQDLYLYTNQLTCLLLNNLPSLRFLDCRNNFLTTLDLSQTANKTLFCSNNPNLQYINIKNGSISPSSGNFILSALPVLQSICADDAELPFVTAAVNTQLPGQNVNVSSFCNFNPNGNYNTIIGNLRFDENANGCNNLDSTMYNVKINIDDGTQIGSTFTNTYGNYKFFVSQNNNTVTPAFENPYFIATPPLQIINFVGYGNISIADFCITANGNHPDLDVTLLPVTIARPGFDAQYKLVYRNKGNQSKSGIVTLNFDAVKLNFLSAIPAENSQTAGNLSWNYTGLSPYQTRTIMLLFHVNAPPVVNIGDVLSFKAVINPIPGDETPNDNTFIFDQVVRGAYDPNDKEVTEGSTISISKAGNYLHYIIRFQNTGNEPATSVVIKDSLTASLDWSSFVPADASHPFRTVIDKGNKVQFIFDGINLPSKNTNEPASHGFVAFKIKPKSTIAVGETIYNKAEIYFDFNQSVITNTVSTTFINPKVDNDPAGLSCYPNPAKDYIWFTVNPGVQVKTIKIYNSIGGKLYSETVTNNITSKKINVANLPTGILFLEIISDKGKSVQKIIRIK